VLVAAFASHPMSAAHLGAHLGTGPL